MYADLFDEEPEEFLGLLRALGCEDLLELVGEAGEGGAVGRRVGSCGEPAGQVGFLLAEGLEPIAVAAEAFLAERGGELAVLERFEVALPASLPSA